jgi:hypothetical protein
MTDGEWCLVFVALCGSRCMEGMWPVKIYKNAVP